MKLIPLILLLIFILSGCSKDISIGACPTMNNMLNDDKIILTANSATGFNELKQGKYDFVVTGRPPVLNEKIGLKTIIIKDGLTIISSEMANAYESEIMNVKISKCIMSNVSTEFIALPCNTYPDESFLKVIHWSEWRGEPFITVYDDVTGKKSMKFRGIYVTGKENDERFDDAVNYISKKVNKNEN
jgi:hypothetical protein